MKVVHCKKEPYDVYIGRPSKFGNPFVIGKDGNRQEVIEKYENWIKTQPNLLKDLSELKGKTLGCWCKPDFECHGDVLVKLCMSKKKIRLSASKVKTLDSCSWIYYCQYIIKVPQTPNMGASRGLVAHTVLECFLNPRHRNHFNCAVEGNITPTINQLILKHAKKLKITDPEDIEMIRNMVIVAAKYDFFCEGSKKIVAEEEFKIESENYIINGFIDKRAEFEDSIKIIDYKTSKAKFNKEEIENNIQGLMYSLACYKKYGKIPDVEFIFLRFGRNPVQFFEKCTEAQLEGFEVYLESIAEFLNNFDKEAALSKMAADSNTKRWMCGKTGQKIDGTPHFICQYRLPCTYYTLKNKDGEIIMTSFNKEDLKKRTGDKIFKTSYLGCPAFKKCEDSFI